MPTIDVVYELVRETMQEAFAEEGLPEAPPAFWIIVSDGNGVVREKLYETVLAPTDVFHKLIEENEDAPAVALVSYVEPHGRPSLMGYVRSRDPDDSDLRRMDIKSPALGQWVPLL